jgi:uncharacterized membrane protein
MTAQNSPPALIESSHRAVIFCYSALLAVFTFYGIWQIPEGNITAIIVLWLIKSLPLLIFAPGLRARKLRTYAWLSFVVLLYFVQGVQTAFTEDARLYGIVISLLLSLLFCALVVYIRSYRGFYKTPL